MLHVIRSLGIGFLIAALASSPAAQEKESKKPKPAQREEKPSSPKKGDKKATPAPKSPRSSATKLVSGPQVNQFIPGSFAPFNVNGKRKDTYHCLVCDYGVVPVILVFAREPAEGKEDGLNDLLKGIDELVQRNQEVQLHAFVVFLSPDAPASAAPPEANTAEKLVKEAAGREALTRRLQARAEKLKNVILTFFPAAGPKEYKISDEAEATVLFYRGLKIEGNYAFRSGELQAENAAAVCKAIAGKLARPQQSAK